MSKMEGRTKMTAKEELKKLISKMDEEQFQRFIDEIQCVLSEEAVAPALRKECQQIRA